jgi:peptidoglycan/xylan/chitin deacetylase (PgdA/CDA1 family)
MEHGIALTFDDAFVDEWLAARPIFDKYSVRATFFVSYITRLNMHVVAKLHQLMSAGHEIGYHSVSHANAVKASAEKGIAQYIADEITPGLDVMNLYGLTPTSFAYPFNARSEELDRALHPHFKILRARTLVAKEALHPPSGNKLLLGKACDIVTAAGALLNSVDDIESTFPHAEGTGKVLVFYAHGITDRPGRYHSMTPMGLEHILATAHRRGFTFVTASELA